MKPDSRRALGASVWLLASVLAACSNDATINDIANEDAPEEAAAPPPAEQAQTQLQAPGSTGDTIIGEVFTKAVDGLTLYTFEDDRNDADGDGTGDSDCNGNCADSWPPLLADDAATPDGQFTLITRDDGVSLQWAFKGLPLYTFAGDGASGEVNGEGVGGVWYVARPDPWQLAEVSDTAFGSVFVGLGSVADVDGNGGRADSRRERSGFTLYAFANDRDDADGDGNTDSDCNDGCAETWPPLFADAGATAAGPFSVVTRDDGTRQWALDGLPLYFFAPDLAPGDTQGEGVGGVWYVARPSPVTPADSDLGPIFATATSTIAVDALGAADRPARSDFTGFSLYVFDDDRDDAAGDGAGDSDCTGACAVTWPPVFADAGASPTGAFSLITRDDGARQWAFKGEPLYLFANDLAAGDVNGDQVGGVWHLARPAPLQVSTVDGRGAIFTARGAIADIDENGEITETASDRTGFTVYRFQDDRDDVDGDGTDDSDCNGGCAVTWPPLYAEAGDAAVGDFGLIDREDGSRQWTYQGDPLYFFSGDGAPGDVNGVYGAWFTVSAGPAVTPVD